MPKRMQIGEMMNSKQTVLAVLILLMAANGLLAQYLDVGDDPAKIQIASKKKIIYNGNPVVGYAWSYDGEWFLGANNDGGYFMDKKGNFLQKLPRKFNYYQVTIFSDNKRIFYEFEDSVTGKDYYIIYSLQTKQETVLPINPLKELFIDISLQGEILFFEIVKIAKKVNYSFFLYNPENGAREVLGMMDQRVCHEYGDNRFLDKDKFLVRTHEKDFFIKKYSFITMRYSDITLTGASKPSYLRLHDGRQVVAVTDGWDTVCLYDDSGKLLGKFRAFFDRGGPDQRGNNHDLLPSYNSSDRELAPNGKLILVRMDEVGDESGNSTDEVYLYNFRGKYVRFKFPYPFGQMLWSPQGDRMLNGDLILFLRKTG